MFSFLLNKSMKVYSFLISSRSKTIQGACFAERCWNVWRAAESRSKNAQRTERDGAYWAILQAVP